MSSEISGVGPFVGLAGAKVLEDALAHQPDICPFVRWHLQRKFLVMEWLFRKYLPPQAKFVDIACGSGEGLLLASLCQPQCELWGLDIDRSSLDLARERVPTARLFKGDMLRPDSLPKDYFDVVHEFGATFFVRNWGALAEVYLSLLRDGGVLLWELPQKWSMGHISYLLSVAPKITPADTKVRRILRSFSPSKYMYETDQAVLAALQATGYDFEILERVPIWYFYCRGLLCKTLDLAWAFSGDDLFDWFDKVNGRILPRYAGYYLVIQKKASPNKVHYNSFKGIT